MLTFYKYYHTDYTDILDRSSSYLFATTPLRKPINNISCVTCVLHLSYRIALFLMCSWFLVCVWLHGTEIADHESILMTSMIVRSKAILMPYKSAIRIEQRLIIK